MLVSFLAYSSTLKMEATRSSETLVDFQRSTWRYIPEDITLQFIYTSTFPIDFQTQPESLFKIMKIHQ
jgi:hypothetical protein